jgi:hypothetical protein
LNYDGRIRRVNDHPPPVPANASAQKRKKYQVAQFKRRECTDRMGLGCFGTIDCKKGRQICAEHSTAMVTGKLAEVEMLRTTHGPKKKIVCVTAFEPS